MRAGRQTHRCGEAEDSQTKTQRQGDTKADPSETKPGGKAGRRKHEPVARGERTGFPGIPVPPSPTPPSPTAPVMACWEKAST